MKVNREDRLKSTRSSRRTRVKKTNQSRSRNRDKTPDPKRSLEKAKKDEIFMKNFLPEDIFMRCKFKG